MQYLLEQEYIGNTENAEQNRKPESAKGDGSLQEFQILAQAIEPADEANNLELLDVKDLSHVNSNQISEAAIPESAKDVILEQKEVPITKESEEVKEANEELAHATNLVSQSSENRSDHKAIDTADDSTDNTNVPRRKLEKEETSIGKAHVDDKSLGTLDIFLHENPQETINGTRIGLSSEEIDNAKRENILGLPLQHQTTKPEHADKESITNLAENEAAGKSTNNSANESQDHSANMLVDVEEIRTPEYNEKYKIAEDNSKEITNADPECKSVETKVAQTSSAVEEVDFPKEIPLRKLPNEEDSLNINETKNGSSKNSENIVNETSNDSFATTLKEVVPQKEENKAPGSDVRGDPTKEIEDHNGTEISESEPKEYLSVKHDPSTVECEKSKEAAMEEKTEAGETINSESINTDVEYLALSESLEKDNQTILKDEKYKEANEQLPRTDQIRESDLEIPSSQELSKETEMKKG